MGHSVKISYSVHVHDDDSGDWFGDHEDGHWSSADTFSLSPGGSSHTWVFDRTVDNEVRFRIELTFSLSASYNLSFSGQRIIWEGSRFGKDEKSRSQISKSSLQAIESGPTSKTILSNSVLHTGDGGFGKATVSVEVGTKPPPKLQFKPQLAFSLEKIVLNDEYYLRRPRSVDLELDFSCFGVNNKISKPLTLALPEKVHEVEINKTLGSRKATFPEFLNKLPGSLKVKIKEAYVWYMPIAHVEFIASPPIQARSQDQGLSFQKWVQTNGQVREYTKPFVIQLGYQYQLHFEAKMTFDYSLVKNELAKVKNVENAIGYYLEKWEESMSKVEENVQIKLEVENINATPKVHKGKPVRVSKEIDKGRNSIFLDADGYAMTREEFVLAIKQGLYPGYHIRKLRGIETPVSDPDNTVANNLG